ncbi:MAG: class I SAM-dependent methyltransferase [Terriglobia bacterium]
MTRRFILVGILLLATGCWMLRAQVADQQHHPPESSDAYIKALEDPSREEWQRPDMVVDRLDLRQGDEVADLGAGSGYFTIRLARAVGAQGKVYAVDIEQKMLDHINARAQKEQLDNIQTILADPNDPNLGSASVDLIFICDTLHHIEHRNAYYKLLLRALRPGGRLVNVDFQKRSLPVGPPVEMKIDRKACIKEIQAAGFHLLQDIEFLKYQYFLVFEREG